MPNNSDIFKTITFLRFPAILLVVILHAYTVARGFNLEYGNCYGHIAYMLSLCMGEIGVPLFFTISGFLFYHNYNNISSYYNKIKRRTHSLLIPYLFWNAFMILFYWILQSIPQLDSFFSGANQPIRDYNVEDFINAFWDCGSWEGGNGMPILQPYWYIRNLIVLSICSPIMFYYIKYLKWIGFIIPAIGWIVAPHLALSLASITFFSLGAFFSINKIEISDKIKSYRSAIIILFAFLLIGEYFLHFYFYSPFNLYFHRVVLIAGVPFLFSIASFIKNKLTIPSLFTESTFLIYTIHLPIILAIRKVLYRLFSSTSDIMNLLQYFMSIVLTISICISIYYISNKYFPKFLSIITGR